MNKAVSIKKARRQKIIRQYAEFYHKPINYMKREERSAYITSNNNLATKGAVK